MGVRYWVWGPDDGVLDTGYQIPQLIHHTLATSYLYYTYTLLYLHILYILPIILYIYPIYYIIPYIKKLSGYPI